MNLRRWSWAGASSTGTSHVKAGTGCDDAAACLEYPSDNGPTLIAVVSDGAGSAHLSSLGASIVVRSFCRSAKAFATSGRRTGDVVQEVAEEWLDDMRDRIEHEARIRSAHRRSFAATLVGCLVQDCGLAVVHVGDGACAVRMRNETKWTVPSWPTQGEYASTTCFVTDDPKPRTTVTRIGGDVSELAVFSDGLQGVALDFRVENAFEPFFESIFSPLRSAEPGRARQLSVRLRTFLDGESVTQRTDDDKTLIMARRT